MLETKILRRILLEKKIFTQEEFGTIIKKAQEKEISPFIYLFQKNILSEETFYQSLAEMLDLPFVDVKSESFDATAFQIIPRFFWETETLVGYKKIGTRLFVTTSKPSFINRKLEEYLQYKTGLFLRWSISSPNSLQHYIRSFFPSPQRKNHWNVVSSLSFKEQTASLHPSPGPDKKIQIPPSLWEKIQRFLSLDSGILLIIGRETLGKNLVLHHLLQAIDNPKKTIYFFGKEPLPNFQWIQALPIFQEVMRRKILEGLLKGDAQVFSLSEIQGREELSLLYRIAGTGRLIIGNFPTHGTSPIAPRAFRHVRELILRVELIPTICHYCILRDKNEKKLLAKLKEHLTDPKIRTQLFSSFQHFIGKGCKHCEFTGSRGKTLVLALEDASFWQEILLKMKQGIISYDPQW